LDVVLFQESRLNIELLSGQRSSTETNRAIVSDKVLNLQNLDSHSIGGSSDFFDPPHSLVMDTINLMTKVTLSRMSGTRSVAGSHPDVGAMSKSLCSQGFEGDRLLFLEIIFNDGPSRSSRRTQFCFVSEKAIIILHHAYLSRC
jgi:hypothetical protein